jgi:hypothetical protein
MTFLMGVIIVLGDVLARNQGHINRTTAAVAKVAKIRGVAARK